MAEGGGEYKEGIAVNNDYNWVHELVQSIINILICVYIFETKCNKMVINVELYASPGLDWQDKPQIMNKQYNI